MSHLTVYGKSFVFTVAVILLGTLIALVCSGYKSPECEGLYNQYSSASDMGERANIFEKGIDNGCFHYN